MQARGTGHLGGRGRQSSTPREPSTPRGKAKDYVRFNTQPEAVGTRTGMVMPANVPRDEHGFEEADAFFHSSPPAADTRNHTPNGHGYPASSPPMPPPPSTGTRRSFANVDMSDEDDRDSLAADGLLDDEYEVEQITPPPIQHPSSPNPPASVPQRRRQDDDENPFRPVSISSARASVHASEAIVRVNGLHSPFDDVDEDMGGVNIVVERSEIDIEVTEQLEDTHLDEDEDEDSQPIRSHRKSAGLRGPHPVVSSGVTDSVRATGDEVQMDDDGGGDADEHVDVGEPIDDNVPVGGDDYSDVGEPFSDNEPEPMDEGDDDGPQPNVDADHDGDDADLEQQAVDAEDAGGDVTDEDAGSEADAGKTKRGTKRTAAGTATPQRRVKRVSLPEGENQYTGDFVCRRSGRQHFKPIKYWLGERKEYAKGLHGPEITGVLRVPKEQLAPRTPVRRKQGRRGARQSGGRGSTIPPEVVAGLEHLDIDRNIDTMVTVTDYTTQEEVVRKTFLPHALIQPKPVQGGTFFYQKGFGEDGFIAGGVVIIPPGGEKPAKPSGDNAYIFFVLSGAVEVNIANNITPIGPKSMFMVPRGNIYSISNKFSEPATLHFAQGRKVSQNEEERTHALKREAERRQALREERERDRIELDAEDFEFKWRDWSDTLRVIDDGTSSDIDGASDEGPGGFRFTRDQSHLRDVSTPPLSDSHSVSSPEREPEPGPEQESEPEPEPEPEPEVQAPAKRGPGRPRKNPAPEPAAQQAAAQPAKRPRGRPRKNPLPAEPADAAAPVKRGPGRPRKSAVSQAEVPTPVSAKRGPGRPRKSRNSDAAATTDVDAPAPVKRGPGRPRKNPDAPAPAPRGTMARRGRPSTRSSGRF